MLDLFVMEDSPVAISDTAQDLERLAEDLLEAGDVPELDRVLQALDQATRADDAGRSSASRLALDELAASRAMAVTVAAVGEFDEAQVAWFHNTCKRLGPGMIPTLLPPLVAADRGPQRERLATAIVGLGDAAVGPLSGLLASDEWDHCRTGIQLLGRIGGAAAIAALQSLIGSGDALKMREAIVVLVRSDDLAAIRPVAAALQHDNPRVRLVAIDGVVASQDRRAPALLASTLRDLRPFGQNFPVAMQILAAMRRSGDDQAASAVATAMRASSWWHWRQALSVKRTAAGVLASMTCPAAAAALADAARQGGFFLKRCARVMSRAGA